MGANWSQVPAVNIPSWGVTSLVSSPHDPWTLYATRNSTIANSDHVKVSYDNGDSWTDITNDLPDVMVWDLLVSPLSSEYIYLATEIGVYLSTNAGVNWELYNFNLPTIEVYDIDFSRADSTIRIATMGRGVWKSDALLPELTNLDDLSVQEKALELRIHPVPADDHLTIDMELESASDIGLTLLNSQGQALLHEEHHLSGGEQRLDLYWPKTMVASGSYYIRISYRGMAIHRKIAIE
jgi:hypothetical protein